MVTETERHWQALARQRRLYTGLGLALLLMALAGSLWFANETNAGKFWDRLPHFFDFFGVFSGWNWVILFIEIRAEFYTIHLCIFVRLISFFMLLKPQYRFS